MTLSLIVPDELEFLNHDVAGKSLARLANKFTLLKSPFSANIWIIDGLQYPINFNIRLADNSQLTEPKNAEFLLELKTWIAIQEALPGSQKTQYSTAHILKRVRYVLRIIDYFLLSSEAHLLAVHGTAALTSNSFKSLAYRLCQYNCVEEQIYDWSGRLRTYLLENYSHPYSHEGKPIDSAVDNFEPFRTEFSLQLSDDQILNIRRNLYLSSTNYLSTLKHRPKNLLDPIRIALYGNTLYSECLYKLPAELKTLSSISNLKEMQPAPTRSKHEKIVRQNFSLYMSCIKSLQKIHHYGFSTPADSAFRGIETKWLRNLVTTEPDRYRSVPFSVGMFALRKSIEYCLAYGSEILNSTAGVMLAASKREISLTNAPDITPFLSEGLILIGVKSWTTYKPNGTSKEFTGLLRTNSGLYESYLVFIGAVQVMLGLLSARRYAEIHPIRNTNLDQASFEVIFSNGKSGIGDIDRKSVV